MCTISCKVEDNVKKDSELIFEAMGISMSAAINTKLVKTFAGLVEERIKEAEEDANLSPVFSSMEDAKDWLES